MKYYSELLKSFYESEESCLKAEQEYQAKQKKEQEEKAKLAEERKARAKEVEEAMEALKLARKHYEEVLADFCKDYGAFHMSVNKSDSDDLFGLFNLFEW